MSTTNLASKKWSGMYKHTATGRRKQVKMKTTADSGEAVISLSSTFFIAMVEKWVL